MNPLTREALVELADIFGPQAVRTIESYDERDLEMLAQDIEDALLDHNIVLVNVDDE